MARLFIAADIHGDYPAWLMLAAKLHPEDRIAIAGDFFDTRYGQYGRPDFMPDQIKTEWIALENTKYYVYGNCDEPYFFPNQEDRLTFKFNGKKIFLSHGHKREPIVDNEIDIYIYGHTHIRRLEMTKNKLFLNPGSLSRPKDGCPSYAVFENNQVRLIDFENDGILDSLWL